MSAEEAIRLVLEPISTALAKVSNPLIEKVKRLGYVSSIDESFVSFLRRNELSDPSITPVILKCASVAASNPEPCFNALCAYFLHVNVDPALPVTNQKAPISHFLNKLDVKLTKDTATKAVRATLFHVIDCVFTSVLDKMLEAKPDDSQTLSFLFPKLFDQVLTEIESPDLALLRLANVEKWAKLLNKISSLLPTETIAFVERAIPSQFKSPHQELFLYRMFRYLDMTHISNSLLNDFVKSNSFATIVDQLKYRPQLTGAQEAAVLALCNMAAGSMAKNEEIPVHFLQAVLKAAVIADKSPTYLPIIAVTCKWAPSLAEGTTQEMVIELARKFAMQSMKSAGLVLFSLTQLLSEKYQVCMSPFELEIGKACECGGVFDIVMSGCYTNCQEELSIFLVRFALNDFAHFVEKAFPLLTADDFINQNGHAVFDVMRCLLANKDLKAKYPEVFNGFRKDCSVVLSAFLQKNQAVEDSKIFGVYGAPCEDPERILENSPPVLPVLPEKKKIQAIVMRWKKVLLSPQSRFEALATEKSHNDLAKACDFEKCSNPVIHAIALVPLLDYDIGLLKSVTNYIFDKSAHLACCAVRVIQCIVYQHGELQGKIIRQIIGDRLVFKPEELYNILAIVNVLLVSGQQDPTTEDVEVLMPIVIMALTSQFYEIRVQVFNLIDHIPQLSQFFSGDLEQLLSKIALIVSCEVDYAAMLEKHPLSLRDVASSNYEYLHSLYFSTALPRMTTDSLLGVVVQNCYPRLLEIFREMQKQGEVSPWLVNLASVIACISREDYRAEKFEDVLSVLLSVKDVVLLYGLAAAVDVSKVDLFLKMLAERIQDPSDPQFGVFCFAAMFYWQLMESKIESEYSLRMSSIFDSLIVHIDKLIDICHEKALVNSQVCDASNACNTEEKAVLYAMRQLLWVMDHMFHFYMKQHVEPVEGPCMRNNAFALLPDETIPQREKWFVFLFNISMNTHDEPLAMSGKRVFAEFCAISQIPDSTYGLISQATDSFAKLADDNPQAFTYILSHAYQVGLRPAIAMARKDPFFFACLAKQFVKIRSIREAASLIEMKAMGPMTSKDNDFIQDTMGMVGYFVGLSLFYLSGHFHGYEKYSMRVLKNLSLTCSIVRNNPGFKNLLAYLSTCNGEMSYRDVKKLSDLLSKAFEFAAEQVIFCAFEIIQTFDCPLLTFIGLLRPWILLVKLTTSVGIVPNGYSLYLSFSGFTFMQLFVRTLCKPPLLPQVVELLNSFIDADPQNHRDLLFVFALHAFGDIREQCKTLLHFICADNEENLSNLCSILQFKYWYYDMIQLGKIDQNFDVIKFLKSLEQVDDDTANREADVDEYANTTDFALEVLLEMLNDFVKPHVLAFCSVLPLADTGDQFAQRRREAIMKLLGSENITVSSIGKVLNQTQMSSFFDDCFAWASSCGDMDIATRAASLVLQMPFYLRQEMCSELSRTLEILVKTVYQKNEPNTSRDSRKWFIIISSDSETNMNQIYEYISQVIAMLSMANQEGSVPIPSVFWLISEFLVATDSSYGAMFLNVVNAIHSHIEMKVDTSGCPENYDGFLSKFVSHDSVLDLKWGATAITKLFEAITMLAGQGAYKTCLGCTETEAQAIAAIALLLIPYFATQCSEALFEAVAAQFSEVVDIRVVWKDFRAHETSIEESDFMQTLKPLLVPDILAQIIRAYALYVKSVPSSAMSVYAICSSLLSLDPCPVSPDSFARIVNFALKDRIYANTEAACALIDVYQKQATFNMKSSIIRASKFPVTQLPETFAPEVWKPSDSVHECLESFPPMVMIDQNLRILPYVTAIKKSCASVRVRPFTNWAKLFFDAQLLRGDEEQVDEYKVKPVTAEDVERFRNTIPSLEVESKRIPVADSMKGLKRVHTDEIFRITTSIFSPDCDVIDEAGADMGFDDFPTIFPK